MTEANDHFMERLAGHTSLKNLFRRLISKDKLPHALLFYGPGGVGKEAAGIELGRFLLCRENEAPCGICASCKRFDKFEHPDFFFLFPVEKPKRSAPPGEWEAGMSEEQVNAYRDNLKAKSDDIYHKISIQRAANILIDQVRQLIQKSALTSYQGGNRFALISPADKMNIQAQNSLLKMLEEPPPGFYLCLATSRPESLLDTIKSRCQPCYFPPLTRNDILEGLTARYGAAEAQAESAIDRAGGSFVKAREILREGDPARDIAVSEFLLNVITNKPVDIYLFLTQKLGKMDRNEAKNIITALDCWLRDIQMMDCGLQPKHNRDLMDRLEKFRKNIKYRDIDEIRRLLLDSIDLIDKNVYLDTIFINLANRMSRAMVWMK